MKVPASLLWGLTRKHSAYRVKRANDDFTKDPTSITNLHNAADSGITDTDAASLSAGSKPSKAGKGNRRTFQLRLRHHQRHATKKTNAGLAWSTVELGSEVAKAEKTVDKIRANFKRRTALKARLYKLHKSARLNERKERALNKKN